MESTDLQFPSLDGRVLAGTVHTPAEPVAALVVLSALGVPRGYYRKFAAWFAERGVAVLTFDYRGVGGSATLPLRKDPATLQDWGRKDISAAVDLALDRWPGLPLWGLGHSFGGQAFGLTPRGRDLAGAVVVAAGSGDLALYPAAWRRRFGFQLRYALPLATAVTGYVPGKLGIGEDLPAGVVREWARWCLTPGYMVGALSEDTLHHARIDAPMRFYDFPDDTYAPPEAAAALRSWYRRASVTHRTVAPADLGLDRIGHFGFFRPGATERVWEEIRRAIVGERDAGHDGGDLLATA